MQVAVDGLDVLTTAIVVIFLGRYLTTHIAVLERYHIPPAVTGGLLCSIVTALANIIWDVEITFDLELRDLLLLFFFSTIGLSAKLRLLVEGGKTIAILLVVAGAMLVLQNLTGVGLTLLFGGHPAYGLFAGSVSFAGGWHALDSETLDLTFWERLSRETVGVVIAMTAIAFLQWQQNRRSQ